MKVKIATIIRVIALIAVLINQVLAVIGKSLGFSDNMIYQIVSAVLTVSVSIYTAWKNNDFTKCALLAGSVFDALKDGKITEDEVKTIVATVSEKNIKTDVAPEGDDEPPDDEKSAK